MWYRDIKMLNNINNLRIKRLVDFRYSFHNLKLQ